jgi:hypothetical protein
MQKGLCVRVNKFLPLWAALASVGTYVIIMACCSLNPSKLVVNSSYISPEDASHPAAVLDAIGFRRIGPATSPSGSGLPLSTGADIQDAYARLRDQEQGGYMQIIAIDLAGWPFKSAFCIWVLDIGSDNRLAADGRAVGGLHFFERPRLDQAKFVDRWGAVPNTIRPIQASLNYGVYFVVYLLGLMVLRRLFNRPVKN